MPALSAEDFKRATAVAIKAIGRKAALEVGFTDAPQRQGGEQRLRLPNPPPQMKEADLGFVRGSADAAALRLRYHNERTHKTKTPSKGKNLEEAREAFDALERARCEALGARDLKGVALNLTAMMDEESRRKNAFASLQKKPLLAQALHFLAWENFTRSALPRDAAQSVSNWRPFIEDRASKHWPKLAALLDDQKAYAAESLRLIASLDKEFNGSEEPDDDKKNKTSTDYESDEGDEERQEERQKETKSVSDQSDDDSGGDTEEDSDAEGISAEGVSAAEDRSAHGEDQEAPKTTYRAFTTQFDETVDASELCSADELTRLRLMLDRQVASMQSLVTRLANRLQRRLMAQQMRHWEFDLEDGLLDAARLARVIVTPSHPLSYKREKQTDFRDTVVTLLLDNSGSMRGRPITVAAMSAGSSMTVRIIVLLNPTDARTSHCPG